MGGWFILLFSEAADTKSFYPLFMSRRKKNFTAFLKSTNLFDCFRRKSVIFPQERIFFFLPENFLYFPTISQRWNLFKITHVFSSFKSSGNSYFIGMKSLVTNTERNLWWWSWFFTRFSLWWFSPRLHEKNCFKSRWKRFSQHSLLVSWIADKRSRKIWFDLENSREILSLFYDKSFWQIQVTSRHTHNFLFFFSSRKFGSTENCFSFALEKSSKSLFMFFAKFFFF